MNLTTESTLVWPQTLSRTDRRQPGSFRTTFAAAYQGVILELKRMNPRSARITGQLRLLSNGMASAEQGKHDDPGVAVYFRRGDAEFVIAEDQYTTLVANMRAVEHILDAYRAIERHGGRRLAMQAFEGFRALTPGTIRALPEAPWYRVLGFMEPPATLREAKSAYHKMLRDKGHPDQKGDPDTFRMASKALAEARTHFSTRKAG